MIKKQDRLLVVVVHCEWNSISLHHSLIFLIAMMFKTSHVATSICRFPTLEKLMPLV